MTVDPDDWEYHWNHQNSVASKNPAQRFRHRLVAREVARCNPARLLDVGSGQGDLLKMLASEFTRTEFAGLELSDAGVKSAKTKVPRADVRQQDLLDPSYVPFASDFDCLTCVEVLEHLDDPVSFLRTALSHLHVNGIAIVTVPSGPRTAFDVSIGHREHFTKSRITQVLENAGLSDVKVRRVGFPFFDLYRLTVLLRGKKLVAEVEDSSIDKSKLARAVMSTFDSLLRVNPNVIPFGWQLVAIGRKR